MRLASMAWQVVSRRCRGGLDPSLSAETEVVCPPGGPCPFWTERQPCPYGRVCWFDHHGEVAKGVDDENGGVATTVARSAAEAATPPPQLSFTEALGWPGKPAAWNFAVLHTLSPVHSNEEETPDDDGDADGVDDDAARRRGLGVDRPFGWA